jgi:hypothetical protein
VNVALERIEALGEKILLALYTALLFVFACGWLP